MQTCCRFGCDLPFFALFISEFITDLLRVEVDGIDRCRLDVKDLGEFPADRLINGFDIKVGYQCLLYCINDGKLSVALFGFHQKALCFVEGAGVLNGNAHI